MRYLFLICTLFSALALAGYSGGGRGGGSFGGSRSFSAPSRSYSAPSRSYSAPSRPSSNGSSSFGGSRSAGSSATITRPAPKPASPPPSPRTSITENHYHGGGGGYYGGGNNGFFTGWLMGSMMHPQQPTVIVPGGYGGVPGSTVGDGAVPPATVVVQPQGPGFFGWLLRGIVWVFLIVLLTGVVYATVYFVKRFLEEIKGL